MNVRSLIVLSCLAAACGDDAAKTANPPADGELVAIEPGGQTICSRGTPFRFFAVGGDTKKVVLDFQGGGACWSQFTCSIEEGIFSAEAPTQEEFAALGTNPDLGGIYKLDDAANPVSGWSLVHVPYCTGDVHWGDATHAYDSELTIHHRGNQNAKAVLDWVEENYPDPDMIFVTGCSAGAYGAIGYASWVAERFPDAQIRVLADSGAGIITEDFFAQSFPNWNALPTLQAYLPDLDEVAALDITDLYVATAKAYPNMRIGQYNTAFDRDQKFYFTAMGGPGDEWNSRMVANVTAIADEVDNFRYYTAPGQIHCIHPYRFYYERDTGPDGAAPLDYVTWLDELINGAELPANIACDATSCQSDPICDQCAEDGKGEEDIVCRWCTGWSPATDN